jgi:hypothetical protein
MLLNPSEHHKHPWKVHSLLPDLRIEDVWQLPVVMESNHSLALLQEQFAKASKNLTNKGLAGMLFKIRFFIGNLMGWDEKEAVTKLLKGRIRERHAQAEGLSFEDLPVPGDGDFTPVYNLEEESLAEIENATVLAAIHLGRVPLNETQFTVQMTIYVKPKGVFGNVYMMLIKPFRHWIVYPALLMMIGKLWKNYLNKTSFLNEA